MSLQEAHGNRYQVVVGYDTWFGQSFGWPNLHFGTDAPYGPSNRRARDRSEHFDRGVPGQDAHRAAASGRAEVGPDDVAAPYQLGAVRAARRAAADTIAGSCGTRR